uniref:Uncharacterized protein n=1 Tax=Acrobeloides nanus TaxID=290746 RepID=A0A914DPW5_9BILA
MSYADLGEFNNEWTDVKNAAIFTSTICITMIIILVLYLLYAYLESSKINSDKSDKAKIIPTMQTSSTKKPIQEFEDIIL